MAEANPTPTATAAAASPALTAEQIQAIVTKSVADALAQQAAQQATQAAAQQQSASQASAANAAAAKPLTAEDVAKLLDARDQQRNQTAAREKFQAEKLKDLPAAYRNQLGDDPAKWAAEEQAVRSQYQADLKAAGITAPNVSGNAATGTAPAPSGKVDLSKLNPVQKIQLGLKEQAMQPGTVNQAAQAILNPSPTATATAT